jgi:hypothetical protein
LLEAGATLNEVRDFLGHANVTMTNTYLSTTPMHLKNAMRKAEQARRIRTPFAQTADSADQPPTDADASVDVKSLH